MRLLYLVFVVSTVALLWAAWAVARTVRRHRQGEGGGTLNLTDRGPRDEDTRDDHQ